ncbi:MAG: hypothetical protein LLF87_00245 [Eubacteriales bacterium]|nr:hypothetical protein [Eubacteriales bacterium]
MKTLPRRNGSFLFLTELLISILVLAAAAALCAGLFADARALRQKSAALTKAVALAENAAEAFKGRNGELAKLLSLPEGETARIGAYSLGYDARGAACKTENAAYVLRLSLAEENDLKTADIEVLGAAGETLYALTAQALDAQAPNAQAAGEAEP